MTTRPTRQTASLIVYLAMAVTVHVCTTARDARGCAVCATSDPTLSPVDGEATFAGRLQASLDLREGWAEAASVTVTDHRAELAIHYAPTRSLLLTLGVPVLLRDASGPSVPPLRSEAVGDTELRVDRTQSWRSSGGVRHRFGAFFELKLPTSPLADDGLGRPLPSAIQPGCGSLVPAGGLNYAVSRGAWSLSTSFSVWLPFAVRSGYHAGDSVRVGARLQWQPWSWLAFRTGGNLNADASGVLGHGVVDPSSGGAIAYVAAEVAVRPLPDVEVSLGTLTPAASFLYGDHREGPIAMASVSYDF